MNAKIRKETLSLDDEFPVIGGSPPLIYIDPTTPSDRSALLTEVERRGHEILIVNGGKPIHLYVPDYPQIPENGLYRTAAALSLVDYDGPFVVFSRAPKNGPTIYFQPLKDPPPVTVRSDIDCLRQRDQISFFKRLALSCF